MSLKDTKVFTFLGLSVQIKHTPAPFIDVKLLFSYRLPELQGSHKSKRFPVFKQVLHHFLYSMSPLRYEQATSLNAADICKCTTCHRLDEADSQILWYSREEQMKSLFSSQKHIIAMEAGALERQSFRHAGPDFLRMGTTVDFLRHVRTMDCARLKILVNTGLEDTSLANPSRYSDN